MPRGSLQIGLPCLEEYARSLVRTPAASSASCRPSSISSRTACGSTLMPTPSGFSAGTLSKTLAGTPIWCRLSASVSPPMPPPAIRTVMILSCHSGARLFGANPESRSTRLDSGFAKSAPRNDGRVRLRRLGPEMAEHDAARLVVHLSLEHELVFQRDRARRGRPCRDLIDQPF